MLNKFQTINSKIKDFLLNLMDRKAIHFLAIAIIGGLVSMHNNMNDIITAGFFALTLGIYGVFLIDAIHKSFNPIQNYIKTHCDKNSFLHAMASVLTILALIKGYILRALGVSGIFFLIGFYIYDVNLWDVIKSMKFLDWHLAIFTLRAYAPYIDIITLSYFVIGGLMLWFYFNKIKDLLKNTKKLSEIYLDAILFLLLGTVFLFIYKEKFLVLLILALFCLFAPAMIFIYLSVIISFLVMLAFFLPFLSIYFSGLNMINSTFNLDILLGFLLPVLFIYIFNYYGQYLSNFYKLPQASGAIPVKLFVYGICFIVFLVLSVYFMILLTITNFLI